MRPLELRLRNFRSFGDDDAIFDFRNRSLVGIVGPIGSGKSTMLDAIAFALFGRTPTIRSGTKSLIHQRRDRATVGLRFEVDGEIWEAVRVLRSQSQHVLYRYDSDDENAVPVEKITLERDVNARIVELLGLDFEAFNRSVLLAQGRFAEFLRASPADRDKVLKGVFGHDRLDSMRSAARDRAAAAQLEAERLGVRVEEAERTSAELPALRARLVDLEKRFEYLRKIEPRVTDLEAAIDAGSRELARIAERRVLIAEVEIPDRAVVVAVAADAAAAEQAVEALEDRRREAMAALQQAEEALARVDPQRERETLAKAGALLATYEQQRRSLASAERTMAEARDRQLELTAAAEQANARVMTATSDATAAEQEVARAADNLRSANDALHRARHRDMAATVAMGLAGERTCPVCKHDIDGDAVARTAESTEGALQSAAKQHEAALARSEAAQAAHAAAMAERRVAEEAATAAHAAVERHGDVMSSARRSVEQGATELAQTKEFLVATLGEGEWSDILASRTRALENQEATVADRRKTLAAIEDSAPTAGRDMNEAGARRDRIRLQLAEVAGRLGVQFEEDLGDEIGLLAGVDRLVGHRRATLEELEQSRTQIEEAIQEAATQRSELLLEAGVEHSLAQDLATASTESVTVQKAIDDAEKVVAGAAEHIERREQALHDVACFTRVAGDLTDSQFLRYLLDDERIRLASLGSEHFALLSGGRYRFTDDGVFGIVDLTAADAVRKPESLSGGETFLASLALALSLAEMVSRSGSRLDSFFLDEGFGSLDPEHLDLAIRGIERLVASHPNRLVVVVSHVPEMQERLEDLICLDKDPITGETKVLTP